MNLRIKADERELIDRAAAVQGKNRTAFVLDAARAAAEEILLEQRVLLFSPEKYQAFIELLDQTPVVNEALEKTMKTPAPWEKK